MDTQTTSSYHHRRVVIKLSGKAGEVLRLFALFCAQLGNVSIAEVK
jgi:hypothetical protein